MTGLPLRAVVMMVVGLGIVVAAGVYREMVVEDKPFDAALRTGLVVGGVIVVVAVAAFLLAPRSNDEDTE